MQQLINDGKIVAFASKKLTGDKSRYANIERGRLAEYEYGKEFLIEANHKPLENLIAK